MQERIKRDKDTISKNFDGFANLDILKKYKSDILDLKGKCLRLISDFLNWNGENKEMENRKEIINNEIEMLHDKMEGDGNLKGYRVSHPWNPKIRDLKEIDWYIQDIKECIEKHKNINNSEDYQDLSSDGNNQETAAQGTEEKAGESWKKLLIQRIEYFLSSILRKTK